MKKMARVLSSVHAISTTCSLCWTSLCAACLYITIRPDSSLVPRRFFFPFGRMKSLACEPSLTHSSCVHVCIFYVIRLWHEVQPHSDDSQMRVTAPCSAGLYSVRLAPQCRAFSSTYAGLGWLVSIATLEMARLRSIPISIARYQQHNSKSKFLAVQFHRSSRFNLIDATPTCNNWGDPARAWTDHLP